MLNNPAIKITDIKPTIPRYQLSRFSRMQPNKTGDWVRYCDYVQDMEQANINYQRALNKLEVIKEQLDKIKALRDGAKRIADLHHNDTIILRRQIVKLRRLIPIVVLTASIISVGLTFLLMQGH